MSNREEMYYKLKEMLVLKIYYARNKWLALNPRQQVLDNYLNDSNIRHEVNDMMGSIVDVIEKHVNEECRALVPYDPNCGDVS